MFSFRLKKQTSKNVVDTNFKENIITKLQNLYSPPRNLRVGNKLPALFLKKPLCTGDWPCAKYSLKRLRYKNL